MRDTSSVLSFFHSDHFDLMANICAPVWTTKEMLCDEIPQKGVPYSAILTFFGTMIKKSKVLPTTSYDRSGSERSSDVWLSWIEVKFCTRTQIIGDGPRLFAKENWDFWFSSGFFWGKKITILVMYISFSITEKKSSSNLFFFHQLYSIIHRQVSLKINSRMIKVKIQHD